MENKEAFIFLKKKTRLLGFHDFNRHIETIGPLEIKTSKARFKKHLVKIICMQQISVTAATAIWKRVEAVLDSSIGRKPSIELNRKLKESGLSEQKVNYVNGIYFNPELNISKKTLQKKTQGEVEQLLIKQKGIGPWTVEMVRLFYLCDPNVISLLDLGIKNAHSIAFQGQDYSQDFFDQFSPFNSYLCLYLWRLLEDENLSI